MLKNKKYESRIVLYARDSTNSTAEDCPRQRKYSVHCLYVTQLQLHKHPNNLGCNYR
jgi:predicted site-specific integrase-resolvase